MTRSIALVGATVIDGTGRPARPNTTVLISGERIAAVVDSAYEPSIPGDAEVYDLTGRWLLPGFIEAHCHVGGLVDPEGAGDYGLASQVLPALVRHGITTVRDTGSPDVDRTFPILLAGRPDWPRFFGAGPAIDGVPGGPFPGLWRATDQADARQFVRIIAAAGASFIKAYAWLPRSILAAVVDEAHGLGLPVTGHVGHVVTSMEAVACGIDSLEHIRISREALSAEGLTTLAALPARPTDEIADHRAWRFIDVEGPQVAKLVEALATHGVALTPTLSMTQNVLGLASRSASLLDDDPVLKAAMRLLPAETLSSGYNDLDRRHSPIEFANMLAFVRKAFDAGVPLAVGTDSPSAGGVIPGLAYHNELELFVAAGLSPLETLTAATGGGARLLRRDADLGTIAGGKYADLVVLGSDPLTDIRNTMDIQAVITGGEIAVDRDGLQPVIPTQR